MNSGFFSVGIVELFEYDITLEGREKVSLIEEDLSFNYVTSNIKRSTYNLSSIVELDRCLEIK